MEDSADKFRASSWDEFYGQAQVKERLQLCIEASNSSRRIPEHILLHAQPGYGKTTLAQIVADQCGLEFASLVWPVRAKMLARFLNDWGGGVVLLDEIHRGPASGQETLLTLLLDGYLQLDTGRRIYCPDTCFIGATTEREKVIPALRDRFPLNPATGIRFVDYDNNEMARIVKSMGNKVDITFTDSDALVLGAASGSVPRVARSLVICAQDLRDTDQPITVDTILAKTQMSRDGLSAEHVAYLETVHELGGMSVGLANIASLMALEEGAVRHLERALLKKGMIRLERTGRELTGAGTTRLKLARKETG